MNIFKEYLYPIFFYEKQVIQNKREKTGGIRAKMSPDDLFARKESAKESWQELSEQNKEPWNQLTRECE